MKHILSGCLMFLVVLSFVWFVPFVRADSQQAYQDYLYQFDQYRQTLSSFQRTRDTYRKYRSLTTQTAAITASQTMMIQRNQLLRSYLLFLNENVNENQGLSDTEKFQHQNNIKTELDFLETQNTYIEGITSIDEATTASGLLESHYIKLQTTIRQTIVGISLGKLAGFAKGFDQNLETAKAFVTDNPDAFSPEKIRIINRWLAQTENARGLYQQKYDEIETDADTQFNTVRTEWDVDNTYTGIIKKLPEAKQLLAQASSYLGEVVRALQYK